MTHFIEEDRKVLESLQRSVTEALDHMRRLGQHGVLWEDDQQFYIGPNSPTEQSKAWLTPRNVADNAKARIISLGFPRHGS